MTEQRARLRFATDVAVIVTSVLDSAPATIIDLSEDGAQISGASFAPGTRCQIDREGETIFATVMWAEVDRMGVNFATPLTEGPLYDLVQRRRTAALVRGTFRSLRTAAPRAFGRRAA